MPAAAPGQALFGVFQAFRAWSVQQTYGQLTADVRNVTASTPLYYYYGGGFGNATNYANNPDTFFKLAKQYNVTVIADSANNTGMTLALASLARAYGVKMAQEWTAPSSNSQLAADAVQWIDSYGMTLPQAGGEDFFIHDGTEKDIVGFPIYTSWLPTLKTLSGSYPQQPVALYIDVSQGYGNTSGGSLGSVESQLASLWDGFQAGLTIVTSQEVANGAISLSSFKAILPLNGIDANLTAYKNAGGTLLTASSQLSQYATAYATPVQQRHRAGRARRLLRGDQRAAHAREHHLRHRLRQHDHHQPDRARAGRGHLPRGERERNRGSAGGGLRRHLRGGDLPAASLAEWSVVPGAAPSGTATPSNCARQHLADLRRADRQPGADRQAVARLVQRRLHADHARRREPRAVPGQHRAAGRRTPPAPPPTRRSCRATGTSCSTPVRARPCGPAGRPGIPGPYLVCRTTATSSSTAPPAPRCGRPGLDGK